jgi:glycosyltransferase involved in cell wall biosynthesis
MNKSLTFTVAICSLNGEKHLPETLKVLFDQIPHGTKVIVVDDGSTDRTSQIVEQYGAVVIQHKENMGYGQARQSAVEACETEILAFIDDSSVISSEWFFILQRDWKAMHSSIVALAGPTILTSKGEEKGYLNRNNPFTPIRSLNGKPITFFNRLINYIFPTHSMHSGYIESAGNGNLSVKVAAISQIGAYNTELAHGGEDSELCGRIREIYGPKSIYFDEDLLLTQDCETFVNTLHRSYRYGGTSARAWMRNGGIPTFLPLPAFFGSALLLCIANAALIATIAFLITYPIVISKGGSSRKFMHALYAFTDPYIRLILETAHNFGFMSSVILSKLFLKKTKQKQKVDKK